jgi:ribonuclease E/ribonuclease G
MSVTLNYDHSEDMARAIVTRDGQVVECFFQSLKAPLVTGAIHHATVDRIVHGGKNAFVKLANGENGFLNEAQHLQPGQPVLVQVKSEGRGDKGPGVTRNISLAGVYLIHQPGGHEVYFSRRLDDAGRGNADHHLHSLLEGQPGGWVLRKSSLKAPREVVEQEMHELVAFAKKLQHLPEKQTLCLPGQSAFEQGLLAAAGEGMFEVLVEKGTDIASVTQGLKQLRPGFIANLKIREEKNAFDVNDLENFFQSLSQKKVPLPGGGSLIFERTDTMHVIDVNGGERAHGLDVNMEAAEHILRHIRHRNLGGLIVIDFLKMRNREDRDEVLHYIDDLAAADPHAMEIYGFTRMGLFEISRARRGFALDEILKS